MSPGGRATLIALGGVLFGALLLDRCSPGETPLPPKVQAAVDRHVAASVADTVTTHRLERDTAAAGVRQRAAADKQRQAEATATIERARADSLAQVAAETSHDSAAASLFWHAAYDARTAEATDLQRALDQAGAELQALAARQAATDSIAGIWKTHAIRADSLVAELLPLAQHRDQCKIAWVLNCPTRTQVAVGGAVVGAIGALVATGKIKVPISLKFF